MKHILSHEKVLERYYSKNSLMLDPQSQKKIIQFTGLLSMLPFTVDILSHLNIRTLTPSTIIKELNDNNKKSDN